MANGKTESVGTAPDHQWVLGARLSTAGEHALTFVRELGKTEADELRGKSRLIRRLADPAGYAQLVDATLRCERALKLLAAEVKQGRVSPRTRERARSEWQVLAGHAQRFVSTLGDQVEGDLAEDAEARRRFGAALEEMRRSDPWRWFDHLGVSAPTFDLSNESLAISRPSDRRSIPALDLIYGLMGRCQLLLGVYLQIHEARFEETAVGLRRVTAEVLEGTPSLIRVPLDPETGEQLTDKLTFEDLPEQEIPAVVEAIRRGKAFRVTEQRAAEDTGSEPRSDDEPPPGLARPLDPLEPTDQDTGRDAEAIDLGVLVRQVVQLLPELEIAWSAALEEVDLDAVQAGTRTGWQSLLAVVQRSVTASDRQLEAAGIGTRIPGFPPSPDDLAKLDELPLGERRWRLMLLAEIWAAARLAEAMGAVTEKSARRVRLPSGEVQTWWESGAFALVRARALVLARIFRLAAEAETTLVSQPKPREFASEANEALTAAEAADLRGDSEATVLHCLRGLRARVRHALGPDKDVPEDFLTRLAGVPGWEAAAHPLQRAQRVSQSRLIDEQEIGELVILGGMLLPLLAASRTVNDEAVRRALGAGVEDAET